MGLQVDFDRERIDSETILYQYTEDSWQKRYIPVFYYCLLFTGGTGVVLA